MQYFVDDLGILVTLDTVSSCLSPPSLCRHCVVVLDNLGILVTIDAVDTLNPLDPFATVCQQASVAYLAHRSPRPSHSLFTMSRFTPSNATVVGNVFLAGN